MLTMPWILYQLEMFMVANKLVYHRCDQIDFFSVIYHKVEIKLLLILVYMLCSNVKDRGFFLSFHSGILGILTFVFISPLLVFVLLSYIFLLHMLKTPHCIVIIFV